MPSGLTVASRVKRDRLTLLSAAAALTVVAWTVAVVSHSPGTSVPRQLLLPHAHPTGPAGFALAFLMWMVMMVAMMLPAVLPWILLFASSSREREPGRPVPFPTSLFVGGYFGVWAVYCLAAAWTQLLLQRHALLHPVRLEVGPYAGGVLLLVAGVFQLTPFKSACLRHCRTPLGFFLSHWRPGPSGALRMGARHGLYCLGCCWALMALSFALGLMNLLWMAIVTLLLCVEKIAPGGETVGRLCGLACIVWGLWSL